MPLFLASLSFGKKHLMFLMALYSFGFTPNAQFLEMAPSGNEVRLTCTFSEDIGEKKQTFKIVDEQLGNVLQCQWRERLYCTVGDGYTFDWKWSDTVTVRKLPSQEPEPRTCSCFLVDPDEILYERPCDIQVTVPEVPKAPPKEKNDLEVRHSQNSSTEANICAPHSPAYVHTDTYTTTTITTTTTATTTKTGSSTKPDHSQQDVFVMVAVALSVVSVLLGIVAVTVICICRINIFRHCEKKKYAPTTKSDSGDLEAC